MENGQNREI